MKPLIAITSHFQEDKQNYYSIYTSYSKAIELAGGIPIILPFIEDISLLEKFDGFLISGGGGIKYSEENGTLPKLKDQNLKRYEFEFKVIQFAIKNNKPLLGICRGMQTINETLGGTIHLKINNHSQINSSEQPHHKITLDTSSKLFTILNKEKIQVNSFHKQAVEDTPLNVVAKSPDGTIEAIESKHNFVLGLQFHPEKMLKTNPEFLKIFKSFIEASQ